MSIEVSGFYKGLVSCGAVLSFILSTAVASGGFEQSSDSWPLRGEQTDRGLEWRLGRPVRRLGIIQAEDVARCAL